MDKCHYVRNENINLWYRHYLAIVNFFFNNFMLTTPTKLQISLGIFLALLNVRFS